MTVPVDSTYCSSNWKGYWGYSVIDQRVGRFRAYSTGGMDYSGAFIKIDANDIFTILGPPSTMPLAFEAKLDIAGFAFGGGYFSCGYAIATFSLSTSGVPEATDRAEGNCAGASVGQTLSLPIARRPGESFDLRVIVFALGSSLSSSASATAQLRFAGLPPGYTISSCKGFVTESAVAARRASWGAVKRIYR